MTKETSKAKDNSRRNQREDGSKTSQKEQETSKQK